MFSTAKGTSSALRQALVLIMILAAATEAQTIAVSPGADAPLSASGFAGGPFAADGTDAWTVEETDGVGTTVLVSSDQPWVVPVPTSLSIGCVVDCTESVGYALVPSEARALAPGVYTATFSFANADTGAGDTTRDLVLTVTPASFSVSPAFVNAFATEGGASPAPKVVTLTNNGPVDLNYTVSPSIRSWLSVSKTSGTVSGNESDTFSIFFNAAGLTTGTRSGSIIVTNTTNGAGTTEIPLTLTISSPGVGAVTVVPDGDMQIRGPAGYLRTNAEQPYTLINDSDRFVLWHAITEADWVSITPSGGELAPADGIDSLDEQVVEVRANPAINDLPAGSSVATITFENLTTGVPIATRIVRIVADPVLTLSPSTGGRTAATPGGTNIAGVASSVQRYDFGQVVTLTATAGDGFVFDGWVSSEPLDDPMQNPLVIAMDRSRTIGAAMVPLRRSLTLSVSGSGSGTVSRTPTGAIVENDLISKYDNGTGVTLTAQPDAGSVFAGWAGNVPPGREQDNPLVVSMDRDRVITARFEPAVTLNIATTGNGSVTADPSQPVYPSGATVTLTATPDEGWHFVRWSGDAAGTTATLTVTVSSSIWVSAVFAEGAEPDPGNEIPDDETVKLVVDIVGAGVVSPAGGDFEPDSVVTLIATPDVGASFAGWEGDASGDTLAITVQMNGDKSVRAVFSSETAPGQPVPGNDGAAPLVCGAMGMIPPMLLGMVWLTLAGHRCVRRRRF